MKRIWNEVLGFEQKFDQSSLEIEVQILFKIISIKEDYIKQSLLK